jgi:hypothetical protein
MTDLLDAPCAPAVPAAAAVNTPAVSRTLLLPQDRIAREALSPWAVRLTRELREARRGLRLRRHWAVAVSGTTNNAALIAAHRGDTRTAWELCEAHLRWQSRFGRRSGDPATTGHALQPWINLGRLEALDGRGEAAVQRFAVLQGCAAGAALDLGRGRVAPAGWRVIADTSEEFGRYVERVRVVESLKALLLAHADAALLRFAATLGGGLPAALSRLVEEAVVVAAAGAGEHDRAARIAADAARASTGWTRMVFQLRLGETFAAADDTPRAAAVLAPVLSAGLRLSPATLGELQALYVLTRAAAAGLEAGLALEAAGLARALLDGARAVRDQGFELAALRVLGRAAPPATRPRWLAELAALAEATEYARERAAAAARPSPEIETLYQELAATLDHRPHA